MENLKKDTLTIQKVTIKRFKCFNDQIFYLKEFNLLVGPNNHGKTTLLQALSAWQLAYQTWRTSRNVNPGKIAKNIRGVPIVLPNFHSVPLTDFKHLWTNKRTQWHDREKYQKSRNNDNNIQYQGKFNVEVIVEWCDRQGQNRHFGMAFLYNNEQSILVKPTSDTTELPSDIQDIVLTHIPPFSGLDSHEEYLADGAIRRRIGLSQPGSVVRNVLWRVYKNKDLWDELKENVERYIGVELQNPEFKQDIDPHITCNYIDRHRGSGEVYDLVNGGSGFHQLVTIFAILHWNKGTHLLLDEPDAHLHSWAQSGVLEFLKDMTRRGKAQIIIATHSIAMLDRCKPEEVYSLMTNKPAWLIEDREKFSVKSGLDKVETSVLTFIQDTPFILYVEGTSDVGILRSLAISMGKDESLFNKISIHTLNGQNPKEAREHFLGVKSFRSDINAICVLDPDLDRNNLLEKTEHNKESGLEYHVWNRRHIESYLLVPEAFARAIYPDHPLLSENLKKEFYTFLSNEPRALIFPKEIKDYKNFHLSWFETFDVKREIFSISKLDSSFLNSINIDTIEPNHIASSMKESEIHNDVRVLINKIYKHLQNEI